MGDKAATATLPLFMVRSVASPTAKRRKKSATAEPLPPIARTRKRIPRVSLIDVAVAEAPAAGGGEARAGVGDIIREEGGLPRTHHATHHKRRRVQSPAARAASLRNLKKARRKRKA